MSGDHYQFCSANQPDSEILRAAIRHKLVVFDLDGYGIYAQALEAFYREAFNAGMEAAAMRVEDYTDEHSHYRGGEVIRAMMEKQK